MSCLMVEGWDKYGAANSNATAVAALLTAGEWTSTSGTVTTVAALSATGQAVSVSSGAIIKTLAGNYGRVIGGVRFSSNLTTFASAVQFRDAGTQQTAVSINTDGTLSVRRGDYSGTVLGTSTASVSANTTHYLEWDITFSNTGSYQVWLDGVSILSGSGDTTATANNTANAIELATGSGNTTVFDDLYLFDASGSINNAVLLTSPRIETQFPSGDAAVQFAVGAAIVGSSIGRGGANQSTAANQFRVRPFTPSVNMTLNSISIMPSATNGSIQLRPVVYNDSAGAPGTLLSGGATVTGITSGTAKTMPLTAPQSLVAGTQYWLGHMCDILVSTGLTGLDGATTDRTATSTFASGAPGTAPATSTATSTLIWGAVTVSGANWYEAAQNPTQGALSYLYDATVGHEDLYSYPALSVSPSAIYAVAVKGNLAKSDAGAKTASMRMKSSAADSAGSTSSVAPGTSYGWAASLFPADPNTSAAWTLAALNAAQAGVKVES